MPKLKHILALLFLPLSLFAALAHASGGELIVFTSNSKNPVEKDFKENYLPKIKELAKAQRISILEKNVEKGAPAAVTSTPSIYFQNHLGRSFYIGRYQLIDKVKTFVRTVSRIPQAEVSNEKHAVLVWKSERATVFSPIKLTDLGGELPIGFDAATFHSTALLAISKGANNAKFKDIFDAQRTDRAVYLAIYPYLGTDGKLFISAEMYSQFNCIEPIYKRFENPFTGIWKTKDKLFEEVGAALQVEVFKQLSSTTKGDGMVPIPSKTPIRTWDELGLSLPKAPTDEASKVVIPATIGTKWTYGGAVESGSPVLNFSFLAPMDYYAGEVKTLFGNLAFSSGPSIENALGKFGIETASLTMGDPGLDHTAHELIAIMEHPKAYFTFEKIRSLEHPVLAYGALTQFTVQGTLEFMDIKAPIDVTAQMEPVLNENGEVRIQVSAAFNIRLKEKYGIDGPDGPQPAADTMQFLLNFLLQPTA